MRTDFYEADAFSGSKGKHLATIESDYRWEKGDELWVENHGCWCASVTAEMLTAAGYRRFQDPLKPSVGDCWHRRDPEDERDD